MTENEQAVRGNLRRIAGYGRVHAEEASQAIALLDAKDAEIAEWRAVFNRSEEVAEKAVAHAEQAEAALAEERKKHQAFRKQVSDAITKWKNRSAYSTNEFDRFILPAKPDPLVAMLCGELDISPAAAEKALANLEAKGLIERAGGTISFEGEG